MKKLILSISLVLVIFFIQYKASANNIMASDLTWKCIGKDSFLIKLVVYTDCNGNALISTPIICSNTLTGSEITRLTLSVGTPKDITPVCSGCTRCKSISCSFPYGIQQYSMQGLVRLDGAGSCCNVKISWEQCCRNESITTGAAGANFYTEATLNRCLNPCDNSPSFTNMPTTIACVDQNMIVCVHGQDIDINENGGLMDSITFEWDQPLSAANTPIPYTNGYSFNKPIYFSGFPNNTLPFPEGIHLNDHITFRPMKAEITIMAVKVSEFRKGVKIGEIQRNYQIIVMHCPYNKPPNITTPNNIQLQNVCAGSTIILNFSTTDPSTFDTVTISWNGAISGAKWTNTNGLVKHPTGTLTWTPTDAQVSDNPYTFTVTAKDNACPVRASITQSYQILVKPKPRAKIIVTDSGGGNYCFLAQRIEGVEPVYLWEGESFTFTTNTGSKVRHKFLPGKYPYTMTMIASGCSNTYFDTVKVDSFSNIFENRIKQSDFKIYPNPASDIVNIEYSGMSKWEGKLLIFDHNSKLIYSKTIGFNSVNVNQSLSLKGYTSGMYLLKLENTSGQAIYKIFINNQ